MVIICMDFYEFISVDLLLYTLFKLEHLLSIKFAFFCHIFYIIKYSDQFLNSKKAILLITYYNFLVVFNILVEFYLNDILKLTRIFLGPRKVPI